MFGREKRMLLRHYLENGGTKAELAREFGLSRDTIYRWIATGQLDRDLDAELVRYTPRPPVPHKLDPFKPIIVARLESYPELLATRLFDEVRAAGYTGGYTRLKEFVGRVRPRPEPEVVVRFETPPAHQAQVDFATFSLPWGKRHALLFVLGYSRLLWLHFYRRQTMRTLYEALEAAFAFLGGVPHELLFDQMKSVVIADDRLKGGQLVENAEFLRFADHWGFRPRACRARRPQTKGKVERPVRFVRGSFFYGREFVSDDDLNGQADHWLGHKANVRIHRTTGEQPLLRFERDERALLLPLAQRTYSSLVLPLEPRRQPTRLLTPIVPVERRPLATYAAIAGGGL